MTSLELKKKTDGRLLEDLKAARGRELREHIYILAHLREIECRRLHLARGHSSMFEFCLDFLGYTKAEAHVRLQAARLGAAVPQLVQKIESGELSLSVAAIAQSIFRKENLNRKAAGQRALSSKDKTAALEHLRFASKEDAARKLAKIFGHPAPLKKEWFEVDEDLDHKLTELKGLLAHKNFGGNLTELITIMADMTLKQLRKDKPDGSAWSTEKTSTSSEAPISHESHSAQVGSVPPANLVGSAKRPLRHGNQRKRSRYISIKVRREVWQAAEGRCTYTDPISGKRCNSRHGLEIDHIQEFALGGSHAIENLTLLCSAHNKAKSGKRFDWRGPPG